jgi:hypothetical protein
MTSVLVDRHYIPLDAAPVFQNGNEMTCLDVVEQVVIRQVSHSQAVTRGRQQAMPAVAVPRTLTGYRSFFFAAYETPWLASAVLGRPLILNLRVLQECLPVSKSWGWPLTGRWFWQAAC